MINTIEVKSISKSYGRIKALDNVSFTAKKGDIIALLGPNGSGKTTLLNILSTVLSQDKGDVFILTKNIEFNKMFIKKNLGFLAEGSPLYADMSVISFLSYIAKIKNENIKSIKEIAEMVKITNVLDQKIETLSKGYLRRVSFAQSLLGSPQILLLDEPTDGLDPNQKDVIREVIKNISKQKTIIISTHLLDDVQTLANKIVLINKGKIIAQGSKLDILNQAKTTDIEKAFKALTKEK